MARHNSKDDTSVLNLGGGGNGSSGLFGSRSGSRRGSMMSGDGGLPRNGSMAGGRSEDDNGGDLEYETSQQRKVLHLLYMFLEARCTLYDAHHNSI